MKRTFTFLMSLFLTVGAMWAQVTSLEGFSQDKCYAFATVDRGAWAVDAEGTLFSSTGDQGLAVDASDPRQQFAVLSANNGADYYLYSVSAKKLVKANRSLVAGPADALAIADASSQGEGRVQFRFRDVADSYINLGGSKQMSVDWWGTIDAGNAVLVTEAGDFNAAEAWAQLLAENKAQAQELVEANATNHAAAPALGQYATTGYEAFVAAVENAASMEEVAAAIAAFEASKNCPLFTIDSQKDYALGQSIYENQEGGLYFKATDVADKSMLWAFDMTATEVGLTEKVVVRNAASGNLFWGAKFISVIETEPAVEGDGVFMFKTDGTGSPVHAQQANSKIVRWSSADANCVGGASTWKFTFVGISNPAAYDLSEVAAAFKEQAAAFVGLQNEAALSSLSKVSEMWAEGMGTVESLNAAIEANKLVLKADVEAAMEMMSSIQAVVAFYAADFSECLADAEEFLATLEEGSERYQAWDAAIAEAKVVNNVTTIKELEDKMAALEEAFANLPEDKDPNDYTDAIVNADLSTGDAWNTDGTKGISDGMVKVASESAFDFSQTITLPAGQYKMTAKAVYRYTGSEAEEFAAIEAGTKTRLVNLYAETATYKYEADVMNRYDGASDTDYAAGNGSVSVNGKFVPNSSNAVLAWFNAGQYVNELVFNVQEEGQVKIGLTRTGSIAGDYTNIGAWTLTRLGDAEADPEVEEPTPDPDPEVPAETIDMDLTHLVGTSKAAWEGNNGGPVTIDGISLPEKYETTTATLGDVMWQTVTGLENGKYTVELWANARYTPGRGFESAAADGALDFTYLYANNVEISIEVYHNSGLNSGKSYKLEGVEVTDGTLKMGMTKKAAGSNWHTIQIKSLIYHAPANAALDMAKVDLQAALDAANAVEPKKDDFVAAIAAAQDIYNNSKSVEEIEAATATLLEATKLAILGNASPSNPVLTDFVVNGTFDAGTTGWKTTTGAQNQQTNTNQQGAFTGNFFENWNPSAVTGKIYQVIENVPNGIYDLNICAFVNNFNGAVQFVYANGDKVALTAGEPTAYTVRTIVENNTIEVGFEQTEAVANWMGIDNVSLTYLGEYSNDAEVNMAKANFTAAYDEFNAALAACQAMMLKTNFYEVADAADQLNAQLESTTDIEALNAMVAQLNEATASLNEINAVYAEYDVYVQKFKAAAEWSKPLTTEAAELLEYNMYGGAGMQAMSIDALKQAIEQIKADYVAYAGNAKLYDGNMFDFTYLIQNPDFEANLDGWTGVKANRIGGEGYDGVGGIAEIAEWGASSWNASMSQAITGLPNGKYVVKAAWMAANGIEMVFAANAGETKVVGIGDQGGNIAKDGSVVEMGQGHRGWQYVEVEGLVEDGTLTILVSSSSAAQYQWSNADAFELYYAGVPKVDVAEVALNETTIEFEELGVTFQLEATVTPVDATSPAVTWTSSDDAVATVDENGLVTAVAVGTATITATADGVSATCAVTVTNIYDLDEPIVGEWEDVTYAAPGEWAIIDDAELLGLGSYWEHSGYTNYDNARGVMEFVAGENTSAYLKQDYCPIYTPGTYRLTGKAFHKGATNAVMYVQNNETLTVEIPAAAEGASYENAEEYFTTFSIEFEVTSVTQVNVGYSCDFTNAEDFLVVGGFKLEMKSSTSLRNIFMETIMACESLGYQITQMEALHAKQQAVMANAMPIYEALMSSQKVLKSDVEASIEEMEAVMAEINPVAAYYKGEFMDALYAAEDFKLTLDEASQAYADLEAAISEANDVAAVTTVAELEAKVAALEELMKLIETGIDSIEAEVETVIYDLSGRRVTEMTKGGIYIVNGKKVINK